MVWRQEPERSVGGWFDMTADGNTKSDRRTVEMQVSADGGFCRLMWEAVCATCASVSWAVGRSSSDLYPCNIPQATRHEQSGEDGRTRD